MRATVVRETLARWANSYWLRPAFLRAFLSISATSSSVVMYLSGSMSFCVESNPLLTALPAEVDFVVGA